MTINLAAVTREQAEKHIGTLREMKRAGIKARESKSRLTAQQRDAYQRGDEALAFAIAALSAAGDRL
jgi:hypothetical protein